MWSWGPAPAESKTRRADRRDALQGLPERLARVLPLHVPAAVRAGFEAGFDSDDDFDAMLGLLGLLQMISGGAPFEPPEDDRAVRAVEGGILGHRTAAAGRLL